MSENLRKICYWASIFLIAAFYAAARGLRAADSCLWFDEIFSVHAATRDWQELWRFVALDLIHPPFFYAALKIWIATGASSLFWLRMLPVLFALAAIKPFLLLCGELNLSKRETVSAFVLIAVNGALIRYAQEVRMYSLLFCLSLASLYLFAAFFKRKSKTALAVLCLINLLLVYTHYFGWLLVLSQLTAVCFLRRELLKLFAAASVFWIFAFLPWFLAVWNAKNAGGGFEQNLGWAARPALPQIFGFALVLAEPFYYQQSSIDAPNYWLIAIPTAIIFYGAIFWRGLWERDENFNLLAAFVVVPTAAAFLASWTLPVSVWGARHLIIVFAPFSLLAAISVWRLKTKEIRLTAASFVFALILLAAVLHAAVSAPAFIWCGWSEAAARLKNSSDTPQKIYVFEDDGAYQLWYALKDDPRFEIVSVKGYADMPEDKAFFLPRGFDTIKIGDKTAFSGDEFWLAFRDAKFDSGKTVLKDLAAQNYRTELKFEYRAQGTAIFLIKATKQANMNN
jgi:uncharacterized membrane protein